MSADVRSIVTREFRQVAEEQGRQLAGLHDDLPLLESGLDSLCFAILVVRLELAFGCDPFSSEQNAEFPVTFGDFIAIYEHAVVANSPM